MRHGTTIAAFLLTWHGAQTPTLTGEWLVTWDSDVRTRGAEVVKVNRRTVTPLVLTQSGDSLHGTWLGIDGTRVPIDGRVDGAEVRLATAWRVERGLETRTEMRGAWTGRALGGTMFVRLRMNGAESPAAPRRWEATRR